MNQQKPPDIPADLVIIAPDQFADWVSINDTIMGGSSLARCSISNNGLLLEGDLVEEGGGFVSCRSQVYSPPLDLSKFRGIKLEVEGQGRTLKLAIGSKNRVFGLSEFISGGLRWVAPVPTESSGITEIRIPFSSLKPTVRAKPVRFPVGFDPAKIIQFQLLHSKFGEPGELNPGFIPGDIKILLRSISAFR